MIIPTLNSPPLQGGLETGRWRSLVLCGLLMTGLYFWGGLIYGAMKAPSESAKLATANARNQADATPAHLGQAAVHSPAKNAVCLQSTIVSRNRREAVINGQNYSEGDVLQVDGIGYRLTTVESGMVMLANELGTIQISVQQRPQLVVEH